MNLKEYFKYLYYNYNYDLMPLFDNLKYCSVKDFKNNIDKLNLDQITGLAINAKEYNNKYLYCIDIDIFRKEKSIIITNNILNFIIREFDVNNKNIYLEETVSGGYHIFLFCEEELDDNLNYSKYSYTEYNDYGRKKDTVEILYNRYVVISPSSCFNKNGEIRNYNILYNCEINDTFYLSKINFIKLLNFIKDHSKIYQNDRIIFNLSLNIEQILYIKRYKKLLNNFETKYLYNGEKLVNDPNNKNITGLAVHLKEYNNKFLYCIDLNLKYKKNFDLNESLKYNDNILRIYFRNCYIERTPSNNYHIFFITNKKIEEKYIFSKLNLRFNLSSCSIKRLKILFNCYISIYPSITYIQYYKFAGFPEYNNSNIIHNYLNNIECIEPNDILNKIHSNNIEKFNYNISDVDTQILLVYNISTKKIDETIKNTFPFYNIDKLFEILEIEFLKSTKNNYCRFYSLVEDDGNHPDALLYFNNKIKSKWVGYTVQDFHNNGKILTLTQYLFLFNQNKLNNLLKYLKIDSNKEYEKHIRFRKNSTTRYYKFKINNYISEKSDEIKEILQETFLSNRILIISPTNTGKTTFFYNLSKLNQFKKMTIALPYTLQIEQCESNYNHICCSYNNKFKIQETNCLTYDKLNPKNINYNNTSFLIIDEFHNIVNQRFFRRTAINNIIKTIDFVNKTVFMTATPDYLNLNDFNVIIEFEKELTKNNLLILPYKEGSIRQLCQCIINNRINGKIDVVLTYSKEQNIIVKEILDKYYNNKINIELLSSDNKIHSETYNSIKYRNVIPNNIDILISTNLLVDGIDINNKNINCIYIVNPIYSIDIIQFSSRFRFGFNNYFVLISDKKQFSNIKSKDELLEYFYNQAVNQKKLLKLWPNTFDINIEHLFKLVDPITFEIDHYSILNKVCNKETKYFNDNVVLLQNFLKNYNYFNVNIINKLKIDNKLELDIILVKSNNIDKLTELEIVKQVLQSRDIEKIKQLRDKLQYKQNRIIVTNYLFLRDLAVTNIESILINSKKQLKEIIECYLLLTQSNKDFNKIINVIDNYILIVKKKYLNIYDLIPTIKSEGIDFIDVNILKYIIKIIYNHKFKDFYNVQIKYKYTIHNIQNLDFSKCNFNKSIILPTNEDYE